MSRRGGSSVYEERDYYSREDIPRRGGPPVQVRERERSEVDVIRRQREPERYRRPDFLRDDYGRVEGGELVVRERDTETITRGGPPERIPRQRSESQVHVRERFVERERSPSPPPREVVERVKTKVVERERSVSPPPPERLRARVIETRERVRERSPSPVRYRERIIERERELTPSPPPPIHYRERIIEKEIERSPSPPPVQIRTRITERQRVASPSPSPSPSPPPPIRAPPIHQEIITHHRHIDHGYERPAAPTPPPPARKRDTRETDIDIYTSRNNTEVDITQTSSPEPRRPAPQRYYDDAYYETEPDKLKVTDTTVDISSHRRSVSARPPAPERVRERSRVRIDIRDDEEEAEYYRRKGAERAYIGEAYNGATRDWAIVDVPPGTERVRMDGVGGASEEITWQRYNGVRRSRFIPERERVVERGGEREKIEIKEKETINATGKESNSLEVEICNKRRGRGGKRYVEDIDIREKESGGAAANKTSLDVEISSRRRSRGARYERIEESSDRRVGLPRRPAPAAVVGEGLWTEITKDLVVREAIEQVGYEYEETEFFFYVLMYLRYKDVLQLVTISDSMRRDRRNRIREIERERERLERRDRERDRDRDEWELVERTRERGPAFAFEDERIVQREVIYDGGGRRRRW